MEEKEKIENPSALPVVVVVVEDRSENCEKKTFTRPGIEKRGIA